MLGAYVEVRGLLAPPAPPPRAAGPLDSTSSYTYKATTSSCELNHSNLSRETMEAGKAAAEREFDVVILGASGFTGKYVVREALKFLNRPSSPLKSLALAGRSPAKLSQTLKWASSPSPPPPFPILQADVSDPSSLLSLSRRAKLLLNCVGPFRTHGQPVVAACVDSATDYLDISGEPEFMEKMEALYHEKAQKVGSLVISACGYDSVPAEMGLLFNSRQWVAPATPNRVEAYLSLDSERRIAGNFATYESAVLGVANAGQLQELRRSRPRRARPVVSVCFFFSFSWCCRILFVVVR